MPDDPTNRRAPSEARPPARRWPGRVAALLAVALFGASGVLLADWVSDRDRVAERLEQGAPHAVEEDLARGTAPEPAPDARMAPWLDGSATYSPARRVAFGRDRAWFTVGTSTATPDEVFARRMASWASAVDAAALEGVAKAGPSAAIGMRLAASVATIPGGASLMRLPPDPLAARRGLLRTEPGGVILALAGHGRWEYLTFYFPEGLDLDALIHEARSSKTGPRVLDALGPEAIEALEPALSLGGDDRTGAPTTVLCRAHGPAGAAIDRVAGGLVGRGWRDATEGAEARDPGTRVLTGPDATVWMATADREQTGGLVTVLIGPP